MKTLPLVYSRPFGSKIFQFVSNKDAKSVCNFENLEKKFGGLEAEELPKLELGKLGIYGST